MKEEAHVVLVQLPTAEEDFRRSTSEEKRCSQET